MKVLVYTYTTKHLTFTDCVDTKRWEWMKVREIHYLLTELHTEGNTCVCSMLIAMQLTLTLCVELLPYT